MDDQNTQQNYSQILEEFSEERPNIVACAVIKNGSIESCIFPSTFEKDTLALIIDSTMKVGKNSLDKLGGKNLKRILLKNEQGIIVLQQLANSILFVLADQKTKPGSLLLSVQELATKMA
ncbi:roadblock/LC7 domain-containing protein [Candidatus Uabimicrobium amorphum]|uniref:Roadblock/LAMTOR2 domain-containing protein n=1 Tax=Uabimicrobium amorphum TaxID=2596890 RepID=A0A5S9F180_UABAM|nr:hypothetical protein [Candidatus Uabimicrobium amorphum]BBM82327.1 hypothetical protein UABAM_00670 [Candidatus Uabimicrobium amorphum]